MREVLVVALLAGALATGCVTPTAVDPAALDAPLATLPNAFEAICPSGGKQEGDLCVSRIVSRTTSLQEPFIAVDAKRPGVLAIGVNAGHTVGAVSTGGVDVVWTDVYFSEDDGETWTLSRHPRADPKSPFPLSVAGGAGDPALAFDDDGVLHLTGIASGGYSQGYDVYYTSTPDLGKTWTAPVTFTQTGDEDRNWLTVAGRTLYVSWQTIGDEAAATNVVWSEDAGATWSDVARLEGCITTSPVLLVGADALVACAGYEASGTTPLTATFTLKDIQVLRLDKAAAALAPVGVLEGEDLLWPQLRQFPDGRLLLMVESFSGDGAMLATSADGGATWTEAGHVMELATSDDAWRFGTVKWMDVDRWGSVHFVLGGTEGAHSAVARPRAAHLVLAPDLATVLAEKALVAPPPPASTIGRAYGDHFFGLGFSQDRALIAWTEDRTLAITAFAPVFS